MLCVELPKIESTCLDSVALSPSCPTTTLSDVNSDELKDGIFYSILNVLFTSSHTLSQAKQHRKYKFQFSCALRSHGEYLIVLKLSKYKILIK